MASIAPGKIYTHTATNKAKRSISSTFVNQTDETIEVKDKDFDFEGEDETFFSCENKGLRRIKANIAFVGIAYSDLTLFGVPASVAGSVATELGAQREAKQKELYG